jgi:hypothetical protein
LAAAQDKRQSFLDLMTQNFKVELPRSAGLFFALHLSASGRLVLPRFCGRFR